MIRACEKRPVPFEVLEQKADEIEQTLQNSLEREVSTEYIGELVMDKLRAVDEWPTCALPRSTASSRTSTRL